MGTRSLTYVYDARKNDKDGQALCCFYRQMDGYPSGLGQELAEYEATNKEEG